MRRRNQKYIQLDSAWRNRPSTLQLDPELELVGRLIRCGASRRVILKLLPDLSHTKLQSLVPVEGWDQVKIFLGAEL